MALASLTVPRQMPGRKRTVGDTGLTLLVYGPSGAGKSRLGLTFAHDPRTSPLLWADPTSGTNGLIDEVEQAGGTVIAIRGLDDTRKMTDWLIAEKGGGFKTVFFDDFSEVFNLGKAEVAQTSSTEGMKWESYPQLYERTTNRFRGFLKLAEPVEEGGAGLNVVVAAWVDDDKDEQGRVTLQYPLFAGDYGKKRVGGYFDMVAYLDKSVRSDLVEGKRQRVFKNTLVTLSDKFVVKDRFDMIPGGELEMPTASKLINLVESKRNGSK